MAWTTPASFAPGQLVLDTDLDLMNANLAFLHGDVGAIALVNEVQSVVAAGGTLTAQGTNNTSFGRLKLVAKRTAGTAVDWRIMANAVSDAGELVFFDFGAGPGAERARFDNAGFFGLGTAAPQGALHAASRTSGAVIQGGLLLISAAAVGNTLQTITAAGTVARSCSFWYLDRNNTGPAYVAGITQAVAVGTTAPAYTNSTDQITLGVSGSGAITVQRTSGAVGTHDITLLILMG